MGCRFTEFAMPANALLFILAFIYFIFMEMSSKAQPYSRC